MMDKKEYSNVLSLSKFPLIFEENIGQHDKEIKFIVRGLGYTAFFTEGEVIFTIIEEKVENSLEKENSYLVESRIDDLFIDKSNEKYYVSVLRMSLDGANGSIEIIGENEQKGKVNYFKGNKPKNWITNVPIYEKIRYKEVYPGIDIIFYGNYMDLEYDFLIKPGADLNNISLGFKGGEDINIDDNGNMFIKVKTGRLIFDRPKVFQQYNETKNEIPSSYKMKDDYKLGFQIDEYNNELELKIDPTVKYSSYLGGSNIDYGKSIAVDSSGNVYIVGYTFSANFPTTTSAYQIMNNGQSDIFVTKVNSDGSELIYSTYLGGSNDDEGWSINVDIFGNAYITGSTASSDFPTTAGAYDTSFSGSVDVFITKLNDTGTNLIYSTFLGGSSGQRGYGISIDNSQNAYVTGITASTNFPTTLGAYQSSFSGGLLDTFVTKLNVTGTTLIYSTYLGGNNNDYGRGIAINSVGNAFIVGYTNSSTFPTTVGAYQTSINGGIDIFITKLNKTGTSLVYSTYLGGTANDFGMGIDVDALENVYIAGYTTSNNFPITVGSYQDTFNGVVDVVVTKLNSTGTSVSYSTYLGGSNSDYAMGIALDSLQNAYITGSTTSSNFPTTPGAYQLSFNGSTDAFVTKINNNGTDVLYSTFLGGSGADVGNGIAISNENNFLVAGETTSTNFPTTPGAYDENYNGSTDAFVVRFIDSADLLIEKIAVPDPVLIGGEFKYIIKVTNKGPDIAFDVIVTDTLPPSVQFILGLFTRGTVNYLSGVVVWSVGSLNVGEVAILTIKVKPTVVGIISNTATVTFQGIDLEPLNNTVTITSMVIDIYQQINNINTTVDDIEDKLDGMVPSLITEIKGQLNVIEAKVDSIIQGPGTKLTTGPVVKDKGATTLVIAINNSTSATVSVTITVVNYSVTPGVSNTFTVNVPANSIKTTNLSNPPAQYEVIFNGMTQGVYGWTSTKGIACKDSYLCWFYGSFFNTNNFIASNTFRHADLVKKD